ncbi:MAG TPA: hypothetical protein PKW35_07945 [Nannocystaceae bacterium]|nr:hypothetical protein [Nannocystaceae bacterium]
MPTPLLPGVLPLALLAPASAPEPITHAPQELIAIYRVAKRQLGEEIDRCTGAGTPAIIDDDAERTFAGIAGMLHLFIQNFTYPPGAEPERTDHVRDAALAYERAFDCSPHWDKRHYLEDALALISQRQTELANDKRPDTKPETDALAEDRQRIALRLQALPPPAPPPPKDPPLARTPATSSEPTGYDPWRGRLALRLEAGGALINVREIHPNDDLVFSRKPAFTFAIAPGVRILAGARRRHVFNIGFTYALYRFQPNRRDEHHLGHAFAARLEYGVRIHPRWLSAHLGVEAGIESHAQGGVFGRGLAGPTYALCTAGESLCARARQTWTGRDYNEFFDIPIALLLGLDPFRLADFATRRK